MVQERLLERDIMVSDCSRKHHMEERQLLRLAIRDKDDNDRLVAALQALKP